MNSASVSSLNVTHCKIRSIIDISRDATAKSGMELTKLLEICFLEKYILHLGRKWDLEVGEIKVTGTL